MNEVRVISSSPGSPERLKAATAAMEKALQEEGFAEDGPLGVFVRTQRAAIEELALIVGSAETNFLTRMDALCKRVDGAASELEKERGRLLDTLLKGAGDVLEKARASVTQAMVVKEHIAVKTDLAIARIAEGMGEKLLDDTQKWLMLAQIRRLRSESMRLGLIMSGVLIGVLVVGYQLKAWQVAPAAEALQRCAAVQMWVRIGDDPTVVPVCRLDQVAERDLRDLPVVVRDWFAEWGATKKSEGDQRKAREK